MRHLYSLILYLLTPLALLRLAWRGLRAPDYWRRWPERFGFFPAPARGGAIWVHAVSVGEFQAALPLIKALMARYPAAPVVVTTTTPTGSARVKAALGDAVFHVYAPYDLPGAVSRFLDRIRPQVAVIMETELWPNLFHGCGRRGIPVILANARLSERSAAGYRRIAGLTRQTLGCLAAIAAQSEADAQRLISLGADAARVRVTGNIKFDIAIPVGLHEHAAALRHDLGATRPVWIAASTHEGEDEVILEAHTLVRQRLPGALLVLAPRHPERFARVAQLARKQGYGVVLRSDRRPCDHTTAVFIGDSMGELMLFYAAADTAFVGGSLVPTGGHNMLEPAALGLPVITGPHTFNFAQVGQMLIDAGAARQVNNARELAEVVIDDLHDADLRQSIGEKGRQIVAQNKGALRGLVEIIASWVKYDQSSKG
ncbi:MAG: lipid IV(A) 3-deoxy-D-manno-octulosonic acid transferase [Gammaproteobacteria bacterium]|nr:lipid IV(A) 3-deoxy-D-manno-octulosonic acid transferase [Gammaproteobacteria bacterium]